jgi:glycolate oxidase iron-sulfur subunit
MLFALFTHPGRLRALRPLTAIARGLGLSRLAARGKPGRLRTLLALSPRGLRSAAPEAVTLPVGESRGRVALLQGCVQRAYFGDVNRLTAQVLAAEGYEVHAPKEPRCCGALQMHAGDADGARALAKQTIEALGGFDHVVVNAAGCGSSMKHYGELLAGDPDWEQRACEFASRVRDATELLDGRAAEAPLPIRVAYHDACHLAHAQGIQEQPRALLRSIPGIELVEPEGWEICCGSAGIYNLIEPQAGAELGERKARALIATGADVIAAANPGCTVQIAMHLERLGHKIPVVHPVELLARSIGKDGRVNARRLE